MAMQSSGRVGSGELRQAKNRERKKNIWLASSGVIGVSHNPLGANVIRSLLEGFSGPGELFMYAITAAFAYALAIALERVYRYYSAWKCDESAVSQAVKSNDLEQALIKCGNHPASTLLTAAKDLTSREAIWDAMSAVAPKIEARATKRLSMLAATANIATMLGLLGTVYGLIYALEGLGGGDASRATRLSEGIAAAMTTTAWGLLTGIPALAAHATLNSKANSILGFCESIGGQLALNKSDTHHSGPQT